MWNVVILKFIVLHRKAREVSTATNSVLKEFWVEGGRKRDLSSSDDCCTSFFQNSKELSTASARSGAWGPPSPPLPHTPDCNFTSGQHETALYFLFDVACIFPLIEIHQTSGFQPFCCSGTLGKHSSGPRSSCSHIFTGKLKITVDIHCGKTGGTLGFRGTLVKNHGIT